MSIWKGIKLNSANMRGFLFFLLLTTILATLIKLSKTYEINRNLNVIVTDLPLDKTIHTVSPNQLKIQAAVSGFSILRNSFTTTDFLISYEDLISKERGMYSYEPLEHRAAIQKAIDVSATINNIRPTSIAIQLDSLASKEVAVVPRTEITYATGFDAQGAIEVNPEFITIVGPSEELDKIELLQTETILYNDASASINTQIDIDTSTLPGTMKLSVGEVTVKQQIVKFTEGAVTVPINVLNDPEQKVKILPKTVKVVYKVALDSFENIKASDFQVTCDYDKSFERSDKLALKLTRKPDKVQSVRLSTKQVTFIIVN